MHVMYVILYSVNTRNTTLLKCFLYFYLFIISHRSIELSANKALNIIQVQTFISKPRDDREIPATSKIMFSHIERLRFN